MNGRMFGGAAMVGVALAVLLALSGCSQVAALAPVGGNAVAQVRYGAIDVLLRENVDILEAPTCQAGSGTAVTCTGSTTDGEAIEVVSSTAADAVLEVTVGGTELFSGPLADVIDEAARG
ncbi:hypothetical protein [Agreia bicolorata]|uniref:DUF4333 domain-containing protein n=1 Tax=Agreia bicolorata TaxID=110935 RepID=A0ABR5CBS3_9MICO|nr:hypothetical protein [Agreia bicolorata]KJC63006.1 hypothetical protein TZ00_17820 [Agreia bicolorata]